MFKCLCGGGTISDENKTNHHSKHVNNVPNGTNGVETELTSTKTTNNKQQKESSSNPLQSGSCEAGGTNTNKKEQKILIPSTVSVPQYTEEEELSEINKANPLSPESPTTTQTHSMPSKVSHVRKRTGTHPYKSRDIKGSITSLSPKLSSLKNVNMLNTNGRAISDYFICDNFEFEVQIFDFMKHYKFLIELAIKCLNMGPSVLSPSLFLKHHRIQCVVAILHQNNGKKVPNYYTKHSNVKNQKHSFSNSPILNARNSQKHRPIVHSHRSEKDHIALNNVIGFALIYPHSNCRPYPDSVWMLGWLCTDYHRIRSNECQNIVIRAMIRRCLLLINPHSVKLSKQSISEKVKLHCTNWTDLNVSNRVNKNNKIKEKGIGIYAPFYSKSAQKLYEMMGFEKIAKIGNYYTTDKKLFDYFHQITESKTDNQISANCDAFLYCFGDLAHCRLLLGMEYFSYKKWAKKEKENADDQKEEKEENENKKQQRKHPKIIEEYLQRRIADYHAKQQKEAQILRKTQIQKTTKKQQQSTKAQQAVPPQISVANSTNSAATYHTQTSLKSNHSNNKYAKHRSHRSSNGHNRIKHYYSNDVNTMDTNSHSPNPHHAHPQMVLDNKTSSRHSSIANSQISHHHYANSNHGHANYHHYYASSHHHQHHVNGRGTLTNRPSATPTYEAHSQAVYYPHLSNVSTATYTNDTNTDAMPPNTALTTRGSSFYSQTSHHSHPHMPPLSHHSMNSNQSMHSNADSYIQQTSYHKYANNPYINHSSDHNVYSHQHQPPTIHQRHSSHHKYRESSPYNNNNIETDPYYAPHKSSRNKRYRQSSRHKKPQ